MTIVNMLEAKTNLTKLIKLLENKEEDEIIIARNNIPVAKLVFYEKQVNKRIGLTEGKYKSISLQEFNSLKQGLISFHLFLK